MAIQLQREFQSSIKMNALPSHCSNGLGLHGDACLNIKLLKSFSRSINVVLVLILVSSPMFGNNFGAHSPFFSPTRVIEPNSLRLDFSPLLYRDLSNEGLIKTGDKAVFISSDNDEEDETIYSFQILNDNYDIDFISISELAQKTTISDESLDFAITYSFNAVQESQELIDRALKIGGIAVIRLSDRDLSFVYKPHNYRTVYFRRFRSTIVIAMRKTAMPSHNNVIDFSSQRKLFAYTSEARKAALNNLEDVLLEPPRAASGKSRRYLKKTRFLPDLMGDSLEGYPRRVYIDVGLPEKEGGSGTGWFIKNYPTRNLDFEMYKIETFTESWSGKEVPQVVDIGISGWLRKNVKEEEYVVMKAEAEVVEEMMESKAIRLVDELFMECKLRGHGAKGNNNAGRRAYWECLALYGRLRDEGIAVHQWWG
ncbi:hypothetical protein JCGZ_19064 [Jatropha curcas]|uniref:DUF7870 domain-containing protein n=1 Tax=Jatropha curcas TaxID=180498 RepID=A0A067K832_JATCU|nr:uncharacterized protein LOC105643688 [Jatropha curcas]KDP27984.1 hypothetical protein JCGZ_19064 [Jatropha curcas]